MSILGHRRGRSPGVREGLTARCRVCRLSKVHSRFKELDSKGPWGLCNTCHATQLRVEQKILQDAKKRRAAIENAHDSLAKHLKELDLRLSRSGAPYETRLLYDVMLGIMELLKKIQESSELIRYRQDVNPYIYETYRTDLLFPVVLYTLKLMEGNQVHTHKILGISRNTLRALLFEIWRDRPRLVSEYGCTEYMPKARPRRGDIYPLPGGESL